MRIDAVGMWLRIVLIGALFALPAHAQNAEAALAMQQAESAPETSLIDSGSQAAPQANTSGLAFSVQIDAPKAIETLVERFLDLKRYRYVPDLDNAELGLLIDQSEKQIRQLLSTQGYFAPRVEHTLLAATDSNSRSEIRIRIDPGVRTTVQSLDLRFDASAPVHDQAKIQLNQARDSWSLLTGQPFTQATWGDSKAQVLQVLQAERFATARLASSKAEIDPDQHVAQLQAYYDYGPIYHYGAVQVIGAKNYDAAIAQRLAHIPTGAEYRQSDLLLAQQRLLDSGYYNGASVTLDTDTHIAPQAAPVRITVQEAALQKLLLGVGFNTDSGPGVLIEHTHNKIPVLDWRSISKIKWNRDQKALSNRLLSAPNADLWQWFFDSSYTQENFDDTEQKVWQLRFGRAKNIDQIERTWYMQYDHSKTDYASVITHNAGALSANYGWTLYRFNNTTLPTAGYGVKLEVGAGLTVSPQQTPFVRATARYQGFLSFDRPLLPALFQALPLPKISKKAATAVDSHANSASGAAQTSPPKQRKNGELAVRLEIAGLEIKKNSIVPSNLLFLTGGNNTVRGYGYQQIGVENSSGLTLPGNYMLTGSLEYRRPVFINNLPSDWDSVLFMDAGSVSNTPADLRKLKLGVGAGVLWRSPVGPVQLALAYGLQEHKPRLHMNLGFSF